MTKSSGPRTEPWGTPQEEVWKEESAVPINALNIFPNPKNIGLDT